MKNLSMRPENKVWAQYPSELAKKMSLGGKNLGKLLSGNLDNLNIIFVETEQGLVPNFESSILKGRDLEKASTSLLQDLRNEYVRCIIQDYVSTVREVEAATVIETQQDGNLSFVINIGETSKKTICITVDTKGNIEESVNGVLGRSCIDITKSIEQKLNITNQTTRTWTHEYNAEIEDRVIQVLRLSE